MKLFRMIPQSLQFYLATFLIATGQLSHASKPDVLGYSAAGLGHVGSMTGKSWTVAASHPGGLISCDKQTIAQGYSLTHFQKKIESSTTRSQTSHGFEGGLCLPSTIWGFDAAIGLNWFLPNEHITSLRTQAPRGPMMVFFEDRLDRLAIVSSLGVGQREFWGIGIGLEHLATTVGSITLEGELILDEETQPYLEGDIDFLFESKRRLLFSFWAALTPKLKWGLGYMAPLALTIDLDLEFDGDVASSPGDPILEEVSLLLQSHLYAYATPPRWTSYLELSEFFGKISVEVSLLDWSALEVPLPTSVVTTSLRDETSGLAAVENPMHESWQFTLAYTSPELDSGRFGTWTIHSGFRYEEPMVALDQATLIDVPKLHFGLAVEYHPIHRPVYPTISVGFRWIEGIERMVVSDKADYGDFKTNLSGLAAQLELEWSWQ